MSDKEIINDWDRRIVNFDKIHGSSREAFTELLKSLKLKTGMKIGDLMCGYGDVSYHLLEECKRKSISIETTLLDSSEVQLENSIQNLQQYNKNGSKIVRVLGDARTQRFDASSLDAIVIKMGLHEVLFEDQQTILNNCFASLKKEGRLYIWESFGLDEESNEYFKEIIRKKDELAGFKEMAKNRYFPNRQEIIKSMKGVGLSNIQEIYSGDFNICPLYLVDLKNDRKKINEFNSYVRNLLPERIKKEIHFENWEGYVQMTFAKSIFVGTKS